MKDAELDQTYTALCEAMAQVGEARAPLLLSMVCLALISRLEKADEALPLIATARDQLVREADST